jgi:hypothetical protein
MNKIIINIVFLALITFSLALTGCGEDPAPTVKKKAVVEYTEQQKFAIKLMKDKLSGSPAKIEAARKTFDERIQKKLHTGWGLTVLCADFEALSGARKSYDNMVGDFKTQLDIIHDPMDDTAEKIKVQLKQIAEELKLIRKELPVFDGNEFKERVLASITAHEATFQRKIKKLKDNFNINYNPVEG